MKTEHTKTRQLNTKFSNNQAIHHSNKNIDCQKYSYKVRDIKKNKDKTKLVNNQQQKQQVLDGQLEDKLGQQLDSLSILNICYGGKRVQYRDSSEPYKVYIGKGNNSVMIMNMFRQRWWWQIVQEKKNNDCQLVWTQLRQNWLIDQIKKYNQHQHQNRQNILKYINNKVVVSPIKVKNKQNIEYRKIMNKEQQSKLTFDKLTIERLEHELALPQFQNAEDNYGIKAHNHMEQNYHLCNKKTLLQNMKKLMEL